MFKIKNVYPHKCNDHIRNQDARYLSTFMYFDLNIIHFFYTYLNVAVKLKTATKCKTFMKINFSFTAERQPNFSCNLYKSNK